jgi:hypothetical protein
MHGVIRLVMSLRGPSPATVIVARSMAWPVPPAPGANVTVEGLQKRYRVDDVCWVADTGMIDVYVHVRLATDEEAQQLYEHLLAHGFSNVSVSNLPSAA